jgi:DNA-binding CsgD family transcriptional regulator
MGDETIARLTERQKDCLRLVANGYTSKEIGRQLGLSPSTVDNHILTATQTIGAASRAEAGRLLVSSEARQKLPRETPDLAEPDVSAFSSSSAATSTLSIFGRKMWTLPPVGGFKNDLDRPTRATRIFQVAVAGFGTVVGLAVLIAGAFRLFDQ